MREAVIVSVARTAIGRAKKGTLKDTRPEFPKVNASPRFRERAVSHGVPCFRCVRFARLWRLRLRHLGPM